MSDRLATAALVARDTIRDLENVPLYVVAPRAGTLLTPDRMDGLRGVSIRNFCEVIQPELEAEGRWRGHGIAVAVDDHFPERNGLDDYHGERAIVGAVLHELAHVFSSADIGPIVDPCEAAEHREQVAEALEEPLPDLGTFRAFVAHGPAFTRVLCHIHFRASAVYWVDHEWLVFGSGYPGLECLPSPREFIESLREEFEPLAGLKLRSLADLELIEPPAAYAELWREAGSRIPFFAAHTAATENEK